MGSYIINVLENFLGNCKKDNESKGQAQFNCPECDDGQNKGNLEVNYEKDVFKCWSCKDTNNMYGGLYKLINKYGSKVDLQTYILLKPTAFKTDKVIDTRVIAIPEGLTSITNSNSNYQVDKIKKYLKDRNITDDIIKKFNISYTMFSPYKFRVIFPSYNSNDQIEYFVTRSIYENVKPKYVNADLDKELIIFFEQHINWNATIYLVEGIFDAIVIPNAIPILGKFISDKLYYKLQEKAKGGVVIVLDGDAIKDGERLYTKLNTLNLLGMVKMVKLATNMDLSLINEKYGKKGIFTVLKTAQTLIESRIYD